MKKLKLYAASTIDGFIARKDGSLDWLEDIPNPDQLDYGYFKFYETVDTLVMGRKTYEEVLSFGVEWPYTGKKSYIISSKPVEIKTPDTYHLAEDLATIVNTLKNEEGKDIWIVGGGLLITSLINLDVVDEMLITLTPVIIGEGLPLFPNNPKETKFELIETESFKTGFVNLSYKKA